jgi:hypothetical protein
MTDPTFFVFVLVFGGFGIGCAFGRWLFRDWRP